MPRAAANKDYLSFTGGMNTDSTPLASPEGTARLLSNVDMEVTGEIRRRLGLDFESGFLFSSTLHSQLDVNTKKISLDEWLSVNEDVYLNFFVVRVGLDLEFYNMTSSSPSAQLLGSLTLTGNTDTLDILEGEDLLFSSGKGVLFVTGRTLKPSYIKYDGVSTFTQTIIDMEIRDFTGIDDGLGIEERPTTLSKEHEYNLKNQGWLEVNYDIVEASVVIGAYPSNADIQALGKNATDVFSAAQLDKQYFGNTRTAKGHYIIDAFDDNRQAVSGVTGLVDSTTINRPVSSTFFSSRVWYAGPNGKVYFSQVIEDLEKIGRCYQEQDPTAEIFNELLATDGGVISIPEMGDAVMLESVANGILVFSATGVWFISGGVENFSAVNFQVQEVTNSGVSGPRTVVKVENLVVYWSDSGIYVIASDNSGAMQSVNITDGVLQTDYTHIPQAAKLTCVGTYDRENKVILWGYNSNQQTGTEEPTSSFDSILLYHTTLKAFYTYSISNLTVGLLDTFVGGFRKTAARHTGTGPSTVTVSGAVVTASAVTVTVQQDFQDGVDLDLKYLMFTPQGEPPEEPITFGYKYTLGDMSSRSFHDWETQDGTGANYDSKVLTGYETLGDASRDKQANYLLTYLSRGRSAIPIDTVFIGE